MAERDPIDEKDLPEEGNSEARLYPPVEEAGEGREEDPEEPPSGDASARREEESPG
jgi:hypothetical protein